MTTVLSDEQLAKMFQQGDDFALETLLEKYKSLANKLSRMYFLVGADQDDLQQEATIGLYNACRKYDNATGASFATFARKCILRNIQSAVKKANRKKNQILNCRLELSSQGAVITNQSNGEDEDELCLMLPSTDLMPEEQMIEDEKLVEIKKQIIKTLSNFELHVLKLFLKGETYTSIAQLLNQSPKSIDNALSRIKSKLSFLKK